MRPWLRWCLDTITVDRTLLRGNVSIIGGDITSLAKGDRHAVIVNAANIYLLGGGGVDGAIHRAAGPELAQHCSEMPFIDNGGRIEVGKSVRTPSFGLGCHSIVHTVGPDCRIEEQFANREDLLTQCYLNSLYEVDDISNFTIKDGDNDPETVEVDEVHVVYFPAISTGVYGYPIEEATEVALRAINKFLRQKTRPYEYHIVLVAFNYVQELKMREVYRRICRL